MRALFSFVGAFVGAFVGTFVVAFVVAFVVVATAPAHALADEGPWNPHLVGDRAMGHAGSFVALADDPSTTFHNPGGVGFVRTSGLSGSLTVLGLGERSINDGYQTNFGSTDLESSGSQSLPVFLGGVVRFGPRDAERVRRHALAASLVTPYENDYAFRTGFRSGEAGARILVQHEERARWFGLSYGYRITPNLALGTTLFLSDYKLEHEELERLTDDGPVVDLPPDGFVTRETALDARMWSLVPRLGLVLDIDQWRFGLMFQSPGVPLSVEAKSTLVGSRVDASGIASTTELRRDPDATVILPWELRGGASFRPEDGMVLSVDLSMLGPVGSAGDPEALVDLPQNDETLGLYVPRVAHRNPAFRAALGFGIVFAEHVPIEGGAMIQLPGVAALPVSADEPAEERLTSFGGSLSIGYQSDRFSFAIGTSAVFATGSMLAPRRDVNGMPTTWNRVDADQKTILFFVAGATRTAAQVARAIVEEVGNDEDDEDDHDDQD